MQKDLNFSKILINWYLKYKRDLPWRHTTDPYFIWLSEIMLQQTRVAQGLPYYLRFTEEFPTVFDLAEASEGQVEWMGPDLRQIVPLTQAISFRPPWCLGYRLGCGASPCKISRVTIRPVSRNRASK